MTVIIVMVIAVAIDIDIVIAIVIRVIVSLLRWLSLSSSPTSFSTKIIVFMFVCRRFGPVPIEPIFDTEGDESNESEEGEYCEESDRPQSPTKKES